MQLTSAFCYALLTITMTAKCIQAEGRRHDLEQKVDKRLSRRDATVIVDNMPLHRAFHKANAIVYKRISKHRYSPPASKHVHTRPVRAWKTSRKPAHGHTGKVKYGIPSHKKRNLKPRYGPPKRQAIRSMYRPIKKKPPNLFTSNLHQAEHQTFGEPPTSFDDYHPSKSDYNDYGKPSFSHFPKPSSSDFYKPDTSEFHAPNVNNIQKLSLSDFQKSTHGSENQHFDEYPAQQIYGEPPVDSYGAPIEDNLHDLVYPSAQSFQDTSSYFDPASSSSFKSYQQDQNIDSKYEFSKKLPTFTNPDNDVFVTPIPQEAVEELDLNSYSDIYKYRQMEDKKKSHQKKIMNKPWKNKKLNDEIIVGGQYAEPPARYVQKTQRDNVPSRYISEYVASEANSPYINYKNSNMAFSPQNLNDAFST